MRRKLLKKEKYFKINFKIFLQKIMLKRCAETGCGTVSQLLNCVAKLKLNF